MELCAVMAATIKRDFDTGSWSDIGTGVNPYILLCYTIFAVHDLAS